MPQWFVISDRLEKALLKLAGHPELMIGLGVLAAVPVLAIAGLVLLPKHQPVSRTHGRRFRPSDDSAVSVGWLRLDGSEPGWHRVDGGGVSIGSGPDADIVASGPGIAPFHARIAYCERGFLILSLAGPGSDAVYVNGKPQLHATLLGGETIEIGSVVLTFQITCPALDELTVQRKRSPVLATNSRRHKGDWRWRGGETADTRVPFSDL